VAGKRQFSSSDFLDWLREYLPADPSVQESGPAGETGGRAQFPDWRENRFYYFDPEVATGISHAIEVLALEEANGELLSLSGDFRDFEAYRECYLQLAATIGRVEVLGYGRLPRGARHLHFRADERARDYCGVLYQGQRQQAMFLCRFRSSRADCSGFFSLDHGLIACFAEELSRPAGGQRQRTAQLREFARLEALDQAAKELARDFARQRQALDAAVRRLQTDRRYEPGHFALDLEKGLSRLSEWKSRMPQILARATR
jgi:hypothetical protein